MKLLSKIVTASITTLCLYYLPGVLVALLVYAMGQQQ